MPILTKTAAEAWLALRGNPASWWPAKPEAQARLKPIATPQVDSSITFERGESVFTIGSCFARNIEEHLIKLGFDVPMASFAVPKSEWKYRPNGILNKYHPFSMLNELKWGFGVEQFPFEHGFAEVDGGVLDLQLPVGALPAPRERAVQRRNEIEALFSKASKASSVVITLGLVEAWWDSAIGAYANTTIPNEVVSAHPGRFEVHVLSYAELLSVTIALIDILREHAKGLRQIVMTVSPVPLNATFTGADALVANCYSKAALRTVAEEVCRKFSSLVKYFPSYESVTLSDRNEAWMADQIHATDKIVGFNVSRLTALIK